MPKLIISKTFCVRAQVLKLDYIISTSFNSSSLRSHFNVVPDFPQPILLLFIQSDLQCHYMRCVVTEAFGTLPLSLSWKRFFNSLFSSHLCIRRCSFDVQNYLFNFSGYCGLSNFCMMLFVNLFYFVKIFAFAQSLELHLIYIPCIAIIQAVISP